MPWTRNTVLLWARLQMLVDLARIGLAPRQCECRVIPLYYRPEHDKSTMLISDFHRAAGRITRDKLICRAIGRVTRDKLLHRAAGNRTRSTCTPCMRTTGILRPVYIFSFPSWLVPDPSFLPLHQSLNLPCCLKKFSRERIPIPSISAPTKISHDPGVSGVKSARMPSTSNPAPATLRNRFQFKFFILFVGPPRIELGPYAPEAHVLPAYSGPMDSRIPQEKVGGTGLEPVTPPV